MTPKGIFPKGIFIDAIEADSPVDGIFCVASKRLLETRNGSPYLALTLMDRTGEMQARMWNNASRTDALFGEGDFVRIKADAQRYKDEVQLNIKSLEQADDKAVDTADFMPVAQCDLDQCEKQFDRLLKGIKRVPLGPFLKALFRRGSRTRQLFVRAPAAKRMHQAYIGGLLEHSVAVASLARETARLYPQLDSELLVAGALVHDIGKIEEFSFERPPIDYTDRGRLIGHSALGIEMLDRCAAETGIDHTHSDIMALKHMVLSHHGQREFGASVLPMTPEAMALHLIDDIDAKMSFLGELSQGVQGDGPAWTPYQRLFERFFYLKNTRTEVQDQDQSAKKKHEKHDDRIKQPRFFDV